MLSFFSTVIAILKAIPILDSWVQQFLAFYTAQRIAHMRAENRDAIRRAVLEHDTRDLDKAVGAPDPGKVIDAPGSEIISGPPPGIGS